MGSVNSAEHSMEVQNTINSTMENVCEVGAKCDAILNVSNITNAAAGCQINITGQNVREGDCIASCNNEAVQKIAQMMVDKYEPVLRGGILSNTDIKDKEKMVSTVTAAIKQKCSGNVQMDSLMNIKDIACTAPGGGININLSQLNQGSAQATCIQTAAMNLLMNEQTWDKLNSQGYDPIESVFHGFGSITWIVIASIVAFLVLGIIFLILKPRSSASGIDPTLLAALVASRRAPSYPARPMA